MAEMRASESELGGLNWNDTANGIQRQLHALGYDYSIWHVYKIAKRLGRRMKYVRRGPASNIDIEEVNWDLSDIELAWIYGVTRQWMCELRKRYYAESNNKMKESGEYLG
jgi:hypothetical protein